MPGSYLQAHVSLGALGCVLTLPPTAMGSEVPCFTSLNCSVPTCKVGLPPAGGGSAEPVASPAPGDTVSTGSVARSTRCSWETVSPVSPEDTQGPGTSCSRGLPSLGGRKQGCEILSGYQSQAQSRCFSFLAIGRGPEGLQKSRGFRDCFC